MIARGLILAVFFAISAAAQRTPVLVELFTSEGCSSCPPADALLARLQKEQPVAGTEIIVLGEHVDYWNQLGWADAFSSREFTARQQRYGFEIYTPQMVVDGREQLNGSDARHAAKAIGEAAQRSKFPIQLSLAEDLRLRVRIENIPEGEVILAITEDGLRSSVTRGENAGRSLNHVGVVRRLQVLGVAKGSFSGDPVINLGQAWKRENLRAVVFVQERGSHRVLGAAALSLVR